MFGLNQQQTKSGLRMGNQGWCVSWYVVRSMVDQGSLDRQRPKVPPRGILVAQAGFGLLDHQESKIIAMAIGMVT